MMCEQMNVVPDRDRMMLQFSDLPLIVQSALKVYNKLPEIHMSLGMGGSLFTGKDYTGFLSLCSLYYVTSERDQNTVLNVCEYVEQKYIAKARAQLDNK